MNFSLPASTGRRAVPVMSSIAVNAAQESWIRVIEVASLVLWWLKRSARFVAVAAKSVHDAGMQIAALGFGAAC